MKKFLFFIAAAIVAAGCATQSTTDKPELRFREDGTFKVAQFTDLHWNEKNQEAVEIIKSIVRDVTKAEQPDVVIFTGDVICTDPAETGWKNLISLMAELGVPYAVTMGNHDPEFDLTREEIFDILETDPLFLGEKGPAEISGVGNYVLEVKASDGSDVNKALLYCFDSNDYTPSKKDFGYYGWFERDQIQWYLDESAKYTAANGGTPVNALSFFHMALPEFKLLEPADRLGSYCEPICSPDLNTGMFQAMRFSGDMMGAFIGHDHCNDFIGKYYEIALGYGRRTQWDEDEVENGGRIIVLKENERSFETYCTTPKYGKEFTYFYPAGLPEHTYGEKIPAKNVTPKKNGVSYKYYEGNITSPLKVAKEGKLVDKGTMSDLNVKNAPTGDHYGYEFDAYLNIPSDNFYRFVADFDDGVAIYIDGEEIINSEGMHSGISLAGSICLEKGFHDLKVYYFENYSGERLNLSIESIDIPRQIIPGDMLYVK
jgi:heat shock protein HslJ